MKIMSIPHPMGMEEMTCGTHEMCGFDVHANQKRPIGRRKAPRIMGGSRSSGMTLPLSLSLRAKRVLVMILEES